MLPISVDMRVGRFWDYQEELINENTREEVLTIIEFKKKLLKNGTMGKERIYKCYRNN